MSGYHEEELLVAGDRVPAGIYRETEGQRRIVHLKDDDYLPASLDGRVAVYTRQAISWGQRPSSPVID